MFVIVGLLATAAVLAFMPRWAVWKKVLLLVCIAALTFILWPWLTLESRSSPEWWQRPLWRNLTLYAFMLAGMMFRVMWDEIEVWRQHNAQAGVRRKRRPRFEFWDFLYPILPSLALFQAVLWLADKQDLTLQLILTSFQNGFFWNALLARAKQTIETVGNKS